jgi:hypothetical protein
MITNDPGRGEVGRAGVGAVSAPYAIPLPSPALAGVPAGGIFQQSGPGPGGVVASLPIDSVAADLPAIVVLQVLAAPARGLPIDPPGDVGRPAVLADVVPAGTSPLPLASPYRVPKVAWRGPGRERAELPDVAVLLGAVAARSRPPSESETAGDAEQSPADFPPGGRVASAASEKPGRPDRSPATAEQPAWLAMRREGRAFGVAPVIIYGATSLAMRGSGPGLASALRLRKEDAGED